MLNKVSDNHLSLLRKIVSEMTYNVSMGTLNPTIPYYTLLLLSPYGPRWMLWASLERGFSDLYIIMTCSQVLLSLYVLLMYDIVTEQHFTEASLQ